MSDADPFAEIPPSFTVTLSAPIKVDGREYAELVLREPRQSELRQAQEQLRVGGLHAVTNYETHLISKVAGVPVPVVEQVGVSRVVLAMRYISRFLDSGQATGGN